MSSLILQDFANPKKKKENSSQALDSAIMLTPLYYIIICRFNITILSILNAETSVHEVLWLRINYLCAAFSKQTMYFFATLRVMPLKWYGLITPGS